MQITSVRRSWPMQIILDQWKVPYMWWLNCWKWPMCHKNYWHTLKLFTKSRVRVIWFWILSKLDNIFCPIETSLNKLYCSIFSGNIFLQCCKRGRLCSRVFFNRGQKWWRKLNRIVTSSALLQNGTYIWILVSIKRQFQVVYIDMNHDWKKATLIPAVAAKDRDASNLTRHFHWGLPSSQGGTTPKLKDFGNNFYMNWQRTYCY